MPTDETAIYPARQRPPRFVGALADERRVNSSAMSFLRPYHCRDIASAPSARRGRNEGRRQPIGVKLPRLRKELAAMFEESHKLEKEIVKQLEGVKV